MRAGQFGQAGVGADEAAEAIGARHDDAQAAAHVVAPIVGQGIARHDAFQTAGDGFDGRQRVIQLVAQHAHQALPCLQFLLTQGLREIGNHQQFEGQPVLADACAAHAPAAGAARKRGMQGGHRGTFEADVEVQFGGALAQQALGGGGQQALTGAVHQAQAMVLIEGEDGHGDFAHHGAQQGGGLHGAEALFAQRAAQGIDLAHDFAEGVVGAGRAAAHRKISLAQRAQQIGERLQGEHHALAHGEGTAQPGAGNQHGEGPLHFGVRNAAPQHPQRHGGTGQAGEHGQQDDAAFMTEQGGFVATIHSRRFIAGPYRPYRWSRR